VTYVLDDSDDVEESPVVALSDGLADGLVVGLAVAAVNGSMTALDEEAAAGTIDVDGVSEVVKSDLLAELKPLALGWDPSKVEEENELEPAVGCTIDSDVEEDTALLAKDEGVDDALSVVLSAGVSVVLLLIADDVAGSDVNAELVTDVLKAELVVSEDRVV
jgi:hypothetical protein